jgi:hypothetical protein
MGKRDYLDIAYRNVKWASGLFAFVLIYMMFLLGLVSHSPLRELSSFFIAIPVVTAGIMATIGLVYAIKGSQYGQRNAKKRFFGLYGNALFSFILIALIVSIIKDLSTKMPVQPLLCSLYKRGVFTLRPKYTPNENYIIERNDSLQIEINTGTNDTVVQRIKWIEPCEYELTFMRASNPKDEADAAKGQATVKAKIVKATKDYYVFEMYTDGDPLHYIDTLKRVKD